RPSRRARRERAESRARSSSRARPTTSHRSTRSKGTGSSRHPPPEFVCARDNVTETPVGDGVARTKGVPSVGARRRTCPGARGRGCGAAPLKLRVGIVDSLLAMVSEPFNPAVVAALNELTDDGSFYDEMLALFL